MEHIYILSCEKDGGIYHYLFNNGKLGLVDKTALDRPMYAIIRDNRLYVILREIDTTTHFGGILSFDIDANGSLVNPTEIESTNGIVPCHLEVVGNDAFVVNYLSGNIVNVGKKVVTHSGKGIHPTRQEAPHTHFVCASPDAEYVMCTDLGLDKVFVYTKDLVKVSETKVSDGYGPRHMIFSSKGNFAFVACELSSTVEMFSYSNGKFSYINSYSCLPDDIAVSSTVAAIRRKGDYIYVSNRGHDSIAVFKLENDSLSLVEIVSCGGIFPRDINIVGDYMFSANELSDNVAVFRIAENGALQRLDAELKLPKPLCVASITN